MRSPRPSLVSLLLGCALAVSRGAEISSPGLPRSTPEAQGISSQALLGFVDEADRTIDSMHSFMLVRHGRVVAEGWWSPYAKDEPHSLFSLSKSFTSTAVGLAISEGKLSLDDPILGFFPECAPAQPSKNLRSMRVRDLLRMSSGQSAEDIQAFSFETDQNLVKAFLAMPVPFKPGTHFVYNTEGTYVLSAIVQKVTGQTVRDYLQPRLFAPLGMGHPEWEASAQGISLGGYGLSLRTEDIAAFGELYLHQGMWGGKPVVPAAWVEAATALQTSTGSDPTSDWDQGYGYQFWRCRHGFYRGDGAFGQFCIVMADYDAVVAITSGTKDMGAVMNLVWDRIVPALQAAPLRADRAAHRRLKSRLAHLVLRTQAGSAATPATHGYAGVRYVFPKNSMGLESIRLEPGRPGGNTIFAVRIGGVDERLVCGLGAWRRGMLAEGPSQSEPIAVSGAWTADDTYVLRICHYRTPFLETFRLHFTGRELRVDSEMNVSLTDAVRPQLAGQAD